MITLFLLGNGDNFIFIHSVSNSYIVQCQAEQQTAWFTRKFDAAVNCRIGTYFWDQATEFGQLPSKICQNCLWNTV